MLPAVQDDLSSLAFADARHDYGATLCAKYFLPLQESLPGRIFLIKDEDDAIAHASRVSSNLLHPLAISSPNETYLQLGGGPDRPVAILCDASFCGGLIEHLKHNTIGPVYVLVNRESIYDPGSNKGYTDAENLFVAREQYEADVQYPSYTSSILPNAKLTSVFDVRITRDTIKISLSGDIDREITETDIRGSSGSGSSKPSTSNILEKYNLDELEYQDEEVMLEIQTAFLKKRIGDWMQVLSCADSDRIYVVQGALKNLKDCVVYFCSNDRVPIAYSLYLGVNTIFDATSGYSYFRRDPTKSYIVDTMSYTAIIYSEHVRTKYTENVRMIHTALDLYARIEAIFLSEITKIREVTTVDELKRCVNYALKYSCFQSMFSCMFSVEKYRKILDTFLINPYDPIFETEDGLPKRFINDTISSLGHALKHYTCTDTNAYIHEEIRDRCFAEFDPTKYKTPFSKHTKMIHNTVYGQAILYNLLRNNDILRRFVYECIEKICELTTDENVRIHYSFFADRHLHNIQKGGGTHLLTEFTSDQLLEIANVAFEFLVLKTRDGRRFTVTSRYIKDFSTDRMCQDYIDYIVSEKKIYVPGYMEYIETYNLLEGRADIYEFLKKVRLQRQVRAMKQNRTRKNFQHRRARFLRKRAIRRRSRKILK